MPHKKLAMLLGCRIFYCARPGGSEIPAVLQLRNKNHGSYVAVVSATGQEILFNCDEVVVRRRRIINVGKEAVEAQT